MPGEHLTGSIDLLETNKNDGRRIRKFIDSVKPTPESSVSLASQAKQKSKQNKPINKAFDINDV